ncbi:2-oxoglutarate and iron-dependent oxygenase domain-containing protein [Mitsuaria sp. CC2]|uniref:isopenicillin N synthase family dioxygenase n=1 Tax=Mitsuaria sp. CC2 TaxID=3029186 RepID=UPI003B8DCFD4
MSLLHDRVPVIDISGLHDPASADPASPGGHRAALQIGEACRAHGFFYVSHHGVDPALIERLDRLARVFFALPEAQKQRWPMGDGGRAWRGYFSAGGELTSGRPDWKEGLYLGAELPPEDPRVLAGTPLHGANLWPDVPGLRDTVLEYLAAVTAVGQRVLGGIALSLDLPPAYFLTHVTADPLVLLRLFNYPVVPDAAEVDAPWGVGERTDYGLLTLLYQDDSGGLEVHGRRGWIEAPPLPGTFVCNIGDMLDRMTAGLYRSTPHRVKLNRGAHDRLSVPLFLDPSFTSRVQPIPGLPPAEDDSASRWDASNLHVFAGTYGEYLMGKVGKVFPELGASVLP